MSAIVLGKGDALLIVDLQNDFLPGGALAVPRGDLVIAPINALIALYHGRGLPVYASRHGRRIAWRRPRAPCSARPCACRKRRS
jgi:nicotinamidase-related amidase